MAAIRRSFTDEIKVEVVSLLESRGRPLEHVARELGIIAFDAAGLGWHFCKASV
jgi:transposase